MQLRPFGSVEDFEARRAIIFHNIYNNNCVYKTPFLKSGLNSMLVCKQTMTVFAQAVTHLICNICGFLALLQKFPHIVMSCCINT